MRIVERIPDVSQSVAEPAADVRVEDVAGKLTLRRARFGGARAAVAGLFGAPADFTVTLDGLGAAAWKLLDGQRTVGQVRVELERAFPGEKEVGARLGKFLGTLVSRQMVRLR